MRLQWSATRMAIKEGRESMFRTLSRLATSTLEDRVEDLVKVCVRKYFV